MYLSPVTNMCSCQVQDNVKYRAMRYFKPKYLHNYTILVIFATENLSWSKFWKIVWKIEKVAEYFSKYIKIMVFDSCYNYCT